MLSVANEISNPKTFASNRVVIAYPSANPKNIVTSSERTDLGMDGQEFYTGLHDNKRL
jgi:ABC-type molybdate transport system substrate-binding protein